MENIIEAKNVSMNFKMTKEKIFSLKEYFIKFLKRELIFEEFCALTDVSFSVKKGEQSLKALIQADLQTIKKPNY